MVIQVILLIIGFVLLIKGADCFVDGASGIANKMHISPLVIGLTIVAFGTSAPEAAVSITSSIKGSNGLSLGNVIGSNLFNLLIVAGAAALIKPTVVDKKILKRDFPFSIVITIILLLLFFGELISRIDGIILLFLFAVYMAYTVIDAKKNPHIEDKECNKSVILLIIMLVIGILAIVFGGDMVVKSACEIARAFNVSETLIGLTIVAIGTSLPELVTSITAMKKGEDNIALGNVIGSNIFNILLIVGISSTISPIHVEVNLVYDTLMLIVSSTVVYMLIFQKKKISRLLGVCMILAYFGYSAFMILR